MLAGNSTEIVIIPAFLIEQRWPFSNAFDAHFSFIDYLFGAAVKNEGEWPESYGVKGGLRARRINQTTTVSVHVSRVSHDGLSHLILLAQTVIKTSYKIHKTTIQTQQKIRLKKEALKIRNGTM